MDGNGLGWVGFVDSFAPGVVVNKDGLRTRLQVYKAEILAQFPQPPHPFSSVCCVCEAALVKSCCKQVGPEICVGEILLQIFSCKNPFVKLSWRNHFWRP
jgi:hypothetical protein